MIYITPFVLSLHLKLLQKIITVQEDLPRACGILTEELTKMFDPTYFAPTHREIINEALEMALLFLYLECTEEALKQLAITRAVLDEIFTKNLWLAERLMKPTAGPAQIGTLDALPELVKFQIYRSLYDSI